MSQTPTESIPAAAPTHRNIFARLYYGELSLPLTFWGFGLLGSVVLMIVAIIGVALASVLMAQSAGVPYAGFIVTLEKAEGSTAFAMCLVVPYTFVLVVAQWRAAEKYQGKKIWALLVKICTVYIVYSIPESIMLIVYTYLHGY